jgi:hypothetical protein
MYMRTLEVTQEKTGTKGDNNRTDIEQESEDSMEREIRKAERKAEMEMVKKKFIYDMTNNNIVEKSKHSEEMERCVEEMFQKSEKVCTKKRSTKLEKIVDILKIGSKEDIETVKNV